MLIYATKKLLERVKKWDVPSRINLDREPEQGVLSAWYGTYAVIEKQHVVVLVNDPTFLTVVISAKDFKHSPTEALCTALESVLAHMELSGEQVSHLLETCDHISFTSTRDRSMISRLNRVLLYVTWRMGRRRSLHRINVELIDELYSVAKTDGRKNMDYQTPRERLALELGMHTTIRRPRRELVEVRIALASTQPEVWRTVLMHLTDDLYDLHLVILGCMNWPGLHPHVFYRGLHERVIDERDVILADLLRDESRPLRYVYHHREHAEHVITFGLVMPISPQALPYQVVATSSDVDNLEEIQIDVREMLRYGRE